MPRSRGGRSAPARAPSAPSRPTAPAPQPRATGPTQQQRPMSTTAPGQTQGKPAAQTQQGSGLFGQMASTAAGVAVGSSIGHAVSGWFGGGGGSPAEQPEAAQDQYQQATQDAYAQPMDNGLYNTQQGGYGSTYQQQQQQADPCAENVKSFTRCMDGNQGNLTVCGWYLDQMKACQAAARPY